MKDLYLDMKTYRRLVKALTKPEPCPITGEIENAIKIVLGEIGGIWPASIKGDNPPLSA